MYKTEDFFLPVLAALVSFGGEAQRKDVLDWLEKNLDRPLTAWDWETLISGPIRWKQYASYARKRMVDPDYGWLDPFAPHGQWQITDRGREYFNSQKRAA